MSTMSNRERVVGLVHVMLDRIMRWYPGEFETALRTMRRVDEDRWRKIANARLAERDRLNNQPWGNS